jgi:outer membrane receptor protein involved in Fe transport
MENFRQVSDNVFDTLVAPHADANLLQEYGQWKLRPTNNLELNLGLHILHYSINLQTSIEPRFGMRWEFTKGRAIIAGIGLHSRTEALSVYYANIKSPSGSRSPANKEMELSKALHFVAGADFNFKNDIQLRIEGYYQNLYNIPIVDKITSQYSTINSSERLPDAILENAGSGYNRGIEITVEKAFTKNYYFLVTGSFFNSKYKAGDQHWYNTYYNTRFVTNLLAGKDFPVGSDHRSSIGINTKFTIRGGYRYTPVDISKSLKSKKIVSDVSKTYASQLPEFTRLDVGINFRRNNPRFSWILMLDIQNATNRENVLRKRFFYENGQISSYEELSLGIVPVLNFRVEF